MPAQKILPVMVMLTALQSLTPAVAVGAPLIDGLESDYVTTRVYDVDADTRVYYFKPEWASPAGSAPGERVVDAVLLDGPVTARQSQILDALLKGNTVRYLYLRSAGGYVNAAIRIGEMARAHGLVTVVESGQSCLSACALVFLGGIRRVAGALAEESPRIGFHSPYYLGSAKVPVDADSADGKEDCEYISKMISERAADSLCKDVFSARNVTMYSTRELLELEVATDTPSSYRKMLVGRLPPMNQWTEGERQYYRCKLSEKYSAEHRPGGKTYIPPSQALINGSWQNIGRGTYLGAASDCDAAIVQQCSGAVPSRRPLLDFAVQLADAAVCPLQCNGADCTGLPGHQGPK